MGNFFPCRVVAEGEGKGEEPRGWQGTAAVLLAVAEKRVDDDGTKIVGGGGETFALAGKSSRLLAGCLQNASKPER